MFVIYEQIKHAVKRYENTDTTWASPLVHCKVESNKLLSDSSKLYKNSSKPTQKQNNIEMSSDFVIHLKWEDY